MSLIGLLYKAESQATEQKLDAAAIKALRQEHSVPVLAQIHALLVANLHTVMPGSLLGKALHYMSSQWGKLSLYVEDGHHPIDNNACEIQFAHLWSAEKTGYSVTRWLGQMPAPICILCWRLAKPMVSMPISTCAHF